MHTFEYTVQKPFKLNEILNVGVGCVDDNVTFIHFGEHTPISASDLGHTSFIDLSKLDVILVSFVLSEIRRFSIEGSFIVVCLLLMLTPFRVSTLKFMFSYMAKMDSAFVSFINIMGFGRM